MSQTRQLANRRRLAGVATAGGVLAVLLAARHVQRGWGATGEEVDATLPGDGILGEADLATTRAVSIKAPPQDVWPWLVQIGQDRAGFYSYDTLQNLAGLDIHNAERVVPQWQEVSPGDTVRLHPQLVLRVASVEPDRALVLHAVPPEGDDAEPLAPPFGFTWSFVLRPGPRGSTRLLIRERYSYTGPWAAALVESVQVASFVMTERMLRGIKERAERRPPVVHVP